MQNIELSWHQAGGLAVVLYAGAYAASRLDATGRTRVIGRSEVGARFMGAARRLWPFLREAGTIAALYAVWQLVGTLSLIGSDGAYARGRWLVRAEADLRLPREATVQDWVLPHPVLAQVCNLYYATLHFAALFALLLWLFIRHRDKYPRARTSIIVLTASCLAVQLLPVAPPRLVPQAGVIDVAARYGQSVYGSGGAGVDQLSAMPSVHVGWALLIALIVIRTSSSAWRWWALAYPAVTVFVVVATGNHFWLDGIVAGGLLVVGELAIAAVRQVVIRPSRARHDSTENVFSQA
jgi:PAP2 superfamily